MDLTHLANLEEFVGGVALAEWERRRGLYDPEFEAFVDTLIEPAS